MTKEQITIRTLPLVRLGLVKLQDKEGFKTLNEYVNYVLECHVYKKNQEEKITESVEKRIDDFEETVLKELKETKIELEWNKKLLAKVCANFNVNNDRN